MTMAKYVRGARDSVDYLPAANVAAGDVLVIGELTYVSDLDMPEGTGLTTLLQLSVWIGGEYWVTADAAYPVGTYVYWNPTSSVITTGNAGTVPFGWIVAGPTGLASDGGPVSGSAYLCLALHDPQLGASGGAFSLGAAANDNISNTSAITAFALTATIPASTLEAGDIISIRSAAVVLAQNSTNTNTFTVNIETAANTYTVVANTGAINAAANGVLYADFDILVTSVGNTGGFSAVGMIAGNVAPTPFYVANTAINTNLPITIEATDKQSAASTSNNAQLLELNVSLKRK